MFTQTLSFYWLFGNISPSWIRNNSKFWKKSGEVMRERNIWPLRTQYILTWQNGHIYVNMMSSKGIRTRHHIRMFLCRSLVLKIHQNTGQTLGTTAEGKKTNTAKSEVTALLNVDTLKTFYCFINSTLFMMNPDHFFTKAQKQEITVTHSPRS